MRDDSRLFGKIAIYDLLVPLNDLLFGVVIYNKYFFFLIPMLLYYTGYFSEKCIFQEMLLSTCRQAG